MRDVTKAEPTEGEFDAFLARLRGKKKAGNQTVTRLRQELERLIALGANISDEHERARLQARAREVADYIFRFALEYPNAVLLPPLNLLTQRVAPTRLTHVAEALFGREAELVRLDAAWADEKINVVTLVAWGGVGKTSLVAKWAAEKDLGGADYFDWSFYSQGSSEEGSASGEHFINAALRFMGGEEGERIAASPISARDKGARLAGYVAKRRALLILDGLEPLQYPPSSPLAGELKDPGVAAFLKGIAAKNLGLCIVTTRERVTDLAAFRSSTAPEWKLDRLGTVAGVALLDKLQVRGQKDELELMVEEVDGHALTLNLIGTYLAKAHGGDVRRRDRVDLRKADARAQGGSAFRAIEAYERWLLSEVGGEGPRQLAVLRLLGLFDRPADGGCLAALRLEPAIPGLTDELVEIEEEDWNLAVSALTESGLLSPTPARGQDRSEGLDAHPLVREYFAFQLREKNPEAWRTAHDRLFEHLRNSTPYQPDTLEGLQPLYQAVAHGCHAGRFEEARAGIYRDRILRSSRDTDSDNNDWFYSTNRLGAFGADLGAVTCFFEHPWRRVSPALSEANQAWLLNAAAFSLQALGRLTEALEPMRVGLANCIRHKDWQRAAGIASNLSGVELTLGDLPLAARDSEQAMGFADRSGDAFWRVFNRAIHANVLHQQGLRQKALALFREAERMQVERQPEYPQLYSLPGFLYCDLLLSDAERIASLDNTADKPESAEPRRYAGVLGGVREVDRLTTQSLWIVMNGTLNLRDISLNHLALGRAALYRAILEGTELAFARAEIEQAVNGLRGAGTLEHLLRGLLTRAWLFFQEGDLNACRTDLQEAQEIAERGPMPLFLTDIALYRARFLGDETALAEARRLVGRFGYGRRREELADAEAVLGRSSKPRGIA